MSEQLEHSIDGLPRRRHAWATGAGFWPRKRRVRLGVGRPGPWSRIAGDKDCIMNALCPYRICDLCSFPWIRRRREIVIDGDGDIVDDGYRL
jgi:hypothetical protein